MTDKTKRGSLELVVSHRTLELPKKFPKRYISSGGRMWLVVPTGIAAILGVVVLTEIGAYHLGFVKGSDYGHQESAPIFHDFTGDGLEDIAIRDANGKRVCLVNEGDGKYQTAHFVYQDGMEACATDKGIYNPWTGKFNEYHHSP